MYCNTCPCLRCAVKIVQTGIRRVVYQLEYSMDERTKSIFREAGWSFCSSTWMRDGKQIVQVDVV